MEVVHDVLAQLEDREAGVQGAVERELRLQEVDGSHRLELPEGVKLWSRAIIANRLFAAHQLDVRALPQILHCLAEDGVVHQFKKVLLERVGGSLALLGVEPDMWLEPCRLEEGENAMESGQLQYQIYALLKVAMVNDVSGLVL